MFSLPNRSLFSYLLIYEKSIGNKFKQIAIGNFCIVAKRHSIVIMSLNSRNVSIEYTPRNLLPAFPTIRKFNFTTHNKKSIHFIFPIDLQTMIVFQIYLHARMTSQRVDKTLKMGLRYVRLLSVFLFVHLFSHRIGKQNVRKYFSGIKKWHTRVRRSVC